VLAVAALPLLVLILSAGLRSPIGVLLAAYAAILPLGSSVTLSVGLPAPFNSLTSLVGIAVVLAMIVHLSLARVSARTIVSAVPAWTTFTALCGMSIAWSVDPAQTASEFFLLLSLLGLYVVTMMMPVSRRDLAKLELGIVVGGAVAGAYALLLLATSSLQLTRRDIPRFSTAGGVGQQADPNITAATLVLPLAVALGRSLRAGTLRERFAFGAAAALSAAAIVLTGSRGGMLAGVVTILIVMFDSEHRRKAFTIVGVAAIVVGLIFANAPEDLRRRVNRTGSSGRTDIWRTGLAACGTYCWAGSGLGTFPTVYQNTLHTDPSAKGMDFPFVAHNIWISAAVETGVVGLVLLAFALALVCRDLLRLPRAFRGPPLAGFVGVLVASFFLSSLGFKYFWFAMIYAGLTTLVHSPRLESAVRPHRIRVAAAVYP